MTKYIFTVFDSAAGAFLEPFVAPSIEFALRAFRKAVNTDGHQFNEYPDDYTLFVIGSFSIEQGTIEPQTPQSLGVAITFVEGEMTA